MPLSIEKYENLKNDEITYIDQFLYRFAKLQDVMGQKLIKYIYMSFWERKLRVNHLLISLTS